MSPKPRRSSKLRILTDPSRNPAQPARSKLRTTETDELVARAKSGEREAFDQLVRLTHGDAFWVGTTTDGNEEDARDVVQDAYLRAYKGLARFRGDARFSTWLYRIVANCASTQSTKNGGIATTNCPTKRS